MKMTELTRMLKCFTAKSYHSLQDDYSRISLIPQGDSSVESVVLESSSSNLEPGHHLLNNHHNHRQNLHHLNNSSSNHSVTSIDIERAASGDKLLRVRPRSAGDISESLRSGREVVILHGSVTPTESHSNSHQLQLQLENQHRNQLHHHHTNHAHQSTNTNNTNSSSQNHNHNSSSGHNNGGGGGILSFFGVRFNKSGTRHLDRSSGERERSLQTIQSDSGSDKPGKTLDRDHRYTKFPLTSPSQLQHQQQQQQQLASPTRIGTGISGTGTINTPTILSPVSNSNSNSLVGSVPLQTDSPFDATHIQLTPQTKTYAHPHKSPVPPVKGIIHGANPNKFLAHAVSSLGRRSKDTVTAVPLPTNRNSHSNHKGNKQLKVKSKSDNSLHRVTLNNSSNTNHHSNNSGSGNSSRDVNVLSPNFYPQGEQRLNSVQLGDHATIRLPWTGFQRQHLNNLSTVTPARPHPNTHNNHLSDHQNLDSVRYVECGVWSGSGTTHSILPSRGRDRDNDRDRDRDRGRDSTGGLPRRRARSLERASNFRIFPVSHSNTSSHLAVSPTNGNKSTKLTTSASTSSKDKEKVKVRVKPQSNSLERPSRHRIRQSLSPSEQEILLRNLTFSRVTNQIGLLVDIPPALPKKKGHSNKPPPLGKLHRSAPNSSFSSVESSSSSGDSFNFVPSLVLSAPPSPPPRPPSTLKPESRLIVSTSSSSSSSASSVPGSKQSQQNQQQQQHQQRIRESHNPNNNSSSNNSNKNNCNNPGSRTITTSNNSNCATMFPSSSANRRPVVPRPSPHDPRSRVSPIQDFGHQDHNHTSTPTSSAGSVASGMSLEDARNSGFINKPSKGWLHSDQLLSKEGVTYTVRYIGCLDVNTSMKSLDFDTRSLIAKECINQVCEAAGLKSVDKKRKQTDRRVVRILGLRPRLDQAGSDVHLTITSTCLKLTSLETGTVIATHDLPNISFASGGDATMLDFVAYVAKDAVVGRACFVLECGSGRAQDVITTVGQAFELRFKEYLQKRPAPPPRVQNEDPDREYYNDLPGKLPPESSGTAVGGTGTSASGRIGSGSGLPVGSSAASLQDGKSAKGGGTGRARTTPTLTLPTSPFPNDNKDGMSVNLIDFEAPTPPAFGPSAQDRNLEALLLSGGGLVPTSPTKTSNSSSVLPGHHNNGLVSPSHLSKDPFNMQPFGSSVPVSNPVSPAEQKAQLEAEKWFHGIISRGEAEALVRNDGDFLVRESQATPGQYVLTGLQNGSSKHLLLVDPEGVVRTKDREFDSVIHLIRYHSDNSLPIISAESMVLLRHPVPRPNQVISSSSS